MRDESLEFAKERAWREMAAIDAAHQRGELDDEEWHTAVAGVVVPAYLEAPDARGGSGHTGSAADWEWSRGIVMEAVAASGAFLDVGCANGLLLESVVRWGSDRGLALEPYGLEIAPALAELARARYPQWASRIFVGNALHWEPPRRFRFVRTHLDYVPPPRRPDLLAHLLDGAVERGGRLIVGKQNEERAARPLADEVASWGFEVAGRAERAHRTEPRIAYTVFWIDAAPP